ncbi:hypothetical protein NIES4071_13190 [Calothrix sp. NIES-4071]|nr:hypothetical protein NIES4071_13190 [Calothrix sp. NIES-4071]BAZ55659.1 hypothetical protein NIES4105_13150 [Calothrix sp. NIES-4105]
MNEGKAEQVDSRWWRWPLEAIFPDKKFDGQLQNPETEQVFDFNTVIASGNPFGVITNQIVYYPENDKRELYAVFISGLGQRESESSKRSRRYAHTLETGIANLNNSSYLKMHPIISFINKKLDWINAGLDRLNLSGSPVISNTAILTNYAITSNTILNISGDSHGTILLARGLRVAKRKYVDARAGIFDFKGRRLQEKKWEKRASQLINIFAFGNGYLNWVKGPSYIMVYIDGDVVPNNFGITPQKAIKLHREDIKFLIFDRIFPEGSFEAHNMMYTTQLLRQTFIKNNIQIGDFPALYNKIYQNTLEIAKVNEVPWPSDMKEYTWNLGSLEFIGQQAP